MSDHVHVWTEGYGCFTCGCGETLGLHAAALLLARLAAAERRAEEAEQQRFTAQGDALHWKAKADRLREELSAVSLRADKAERVNRDHAECIGELEYAQENRQLTSQLAAAKEENERLRRGDIAWMIECNKDTPTPLWWRGDGFSPDPNDGVRFAREADAVAVISRRGMLNVKATEHEWFAAAPSPAKEQG